MGDTAKLHLPISDNPNDRVLEYWTRIFNTQSGAMKVLDDQFVILSQKFAFSIPSNAWATSLDDATFTYKAEITLTNTVIADNSTIEALYDDPLKSNGIVLYSAEQITSSSVKLVFYGIEAKSDDVTGVIRYVY